MAGPDLPVLDPARFTDALGAARASGSLVTIDGGLGTLLERSGHDLASELWSARMLVESPAVIRDAHRQFYASGARVGISSSYQVSYEGLSALGFDSAATDRLLALSIRLVEEAREEYLGSVDAAAHGPAWTAASVGPYGAMLADGSEYSGRYGVDVADLRDWHRPRLAALIDAGPDLLAIETIPSLAETEAVLRELAGSPVAAWLALTVAQGTLRSGEALSEAFAMADETPEIVAVGINCSDPLEVPAAIDAARAVTEKPIVIYPNSGEQWDAKNRRWMGAAGFADSAVREWIDRGATLVGGCCRVGPAEIAAIAAVGAGSTGSTPG